MTDVKSTRSCLHRRKSPRVPNHFMSISVLLFLQSKHRFHCSRTTTNAIGGSRMQCRIYVYGRRSLWYLIRAREHEAPIPDKKTLTLRVPSNRSEVIPLEDSCAWVVNHVTLELLGLVALRMRLPVHCCFHLHFSQLLAQEYQWTI